MQRRFTSYSELKERYGLPWTRQHVDRLVRDKKFPPKVKLSEHRVGWWSDQIEEWISARQPSAAA
jgi:predicted DNA-binding transcriptional regulator AlpA